MYSCSSVLINVPLKERIPLLLPIVLLHPVAVHVKGDIVNEQPDRLDVVGGASECLQRNGRRITQSNHENNRRRCRTPPHQGAFSLGQLLELGKGGFGGGARKGQTLVIAAN